MSVVPAIYLVGDVHPDIERVLRLWRLKYTRIAISNPIFVYINAFATDVSSLYILGNVMPSMEMFKSIFERPQQAVMSPVITTIRDGKWAEEGCVYLPKTTQSVTVLPDEVECHSKYATKESRLTFNSPETGENDEHELWSMVVKYWGQLSSTFTKNVLIPAWMHATQRRALLNEFSTFAYHHIASQLIFCRTYEYEERFGTLKDAEQHFLSITTLGTKGVKYVVQERLGKHPLTLPGIVMVYSEAPEVDCDVTVVGHFFDLHLPNKPKDMYIKSLEKWCELLHPIVFYGDAEMCERVMKHRSDLKLAHFTRVFPKTTDDYPQFREEQPYESITLLKPYLIQDAINRNEFLSEKYAYMDPGIYKHDAFQSGEFVGGRLLENIEVVPGKVTMKSMSGLVESDSMQEEYLLAEIMIGGITGWNGLFSKFKQVVETAEKYTAEQKVMTRIATLYPDLFHFILGGFHIHHYRKFFGVSECQYRHHEGCGHFY